MIKFNIEAEQQQQVARWCARNTIGSYTVKTKSVSFSHIEDAEAFNEYINNEEVVK